MFGVNALHILLSRQIKPFVLCYHEVNEDELFRQLSALKKVFEIKNINQLQPNDYGACAITLDDCLKRDAERLFKVAENLKVPVTFYLPVRYCINENPLPGDLIKWLIQVKSTFFFNGKIWKLNNPAQRLKIKNAVSKYIYNEVLKGKDISGLMLEICKENNIYHNEIPAGIKIICPERVAQMSRSDYIKFESHSMTHPAFVNLTDDNLLKELNESAEWIEQTTNKKVESICYPFGSYELIGKKAFQFAKKNYQNGVTLKAGVWANNNKFEIPRIGLYPRDNNIGMFSKIFHYQDVYLIQNLFRR